MACSQERSGLKTIQLDGSIAEYAAPKRHFRGLSQAQQGKHSRKLELYNCSLYSCSCSDRPKLGRLQYRGRVGSGRFCWKSDQQTRPSTAVLLPRPGRIAAIWL